jgi:hypothetical protein
MGDIAGAVETLEDITEQKLAEEALRARASRAVPDPGGSPIAAFVIDRDHQVIFGTGPSRSSAASAPTTSSDDLHRRAFYAQKRPCMADLIIDKKLHESGAGTLARGRRRSC